jgi:hypothetical protein
VGFEYLVIAFFFGLATAIIGRGKAVKLYVQVCPRCGTDFSLPDAA